MRIDATSTLALAAAAFVATVSGTAVRAQSAATNLLGVYEQSANACPNTGTCRLDFSTVQQNLKVLRASPKETNWASSLASGAGARSEANRELAGATSNTVLHFGQVIGE